MALDLVYALTSFDPPNQQTFGIATATITNNSPSTYATNGFTVDVSTLIRSMKGSALNLMSCLKSVQIRTRNGYAVGFTPATAPAPTNIGTAVLFTSGGTETANTTSMANQVWDLVIMLFPLKTM